MTNLLLLTGFDWLGFLHGPSLSVAHIEFAETQSDLQNFSCYGDFGRRIGQNFGRNYCKILAGNVPDWHYFSRKSDMRRSGRLIAFSGHGHDSFGEQALAAGFDAYLVKPVDADQLRRMLIED